jgi:hypothetical protein
LLEYVLIISFRWGTTLAYITQASLVTSIGFAYTQWLWWTLKKTKISIAALDAAFGADSSLVSLLNVEMIRKIKVGSLIALIIGSAKSSDPKTLVLTYPQASSFDLSCTPSNAFTISKLGYYDRHWFSTATRYV